MSTENHMHGKVSNSVFINAGHLSMKTNTDTDQLPTEAETLTPLHDYKIHYLHSAGTLAA